MKGLVGIIVIVVSAALLGGAGFIGYNRGVTAGEVEGYQNGYYEGEKSGYDRGTEEGYETGYSIGEDDGYLAGYDVGAAVGYDSGYTAGEEDGYNTGYSVGKNDGFITGQQSGYELGLEDSLKYGYAISDPTYAQAITFMVTDNTSDNEYIEGDYGVYVCSHFSRDVCNNAEAAGYRCAFVELRYASSGHTIVAFNTIDKGLVFFEPQTDELVKPEIGKRYYQCITPTPGSYYLQPDYDDTIRDILVIW